MKILALLLLAFAGCGGCVSVAPEFNPKSAAVRLEFANGICSGTATGPHEVTTATHCLTGRLVAINGLPANLTGSRKTGRDVTVIAVDRTFTSWAKWRDSAPVQGERIRYWGNPLGIADLYRVGYVSGFYNSGAVLVDVEIGQGDSGAGVYDDRGDLIGVVSGYGTSGPFRMAIVWRRG